MSSECGSCPTCNNNTRWVCRKEGNFYSAGEYSRTIDFFGIHGVSFKQKVDSVKMQLDSNTLQILKVLLTDYEAPSNLNATDGLNVVATIDFIQSRLSTDNTENNKFSNNSYTDGGDDQ